MEITSFLPAIFRVKNKNPLIFEGCDNIWTMELSSNISWQMTDEKYHTVTNAMWSPDGKSIVAVKVTVN